MATMITQRNANVLAELDGELAFITLNRPEKRNALSLQTMEQLSAAMRAVGENSDIKVVILKANGPVFSAGHDLSEMLDRDLATYRHLFDVCVDTMETIQRIRQPVIAQVQGPATAAGCQLVATCDLAVAVDSAWFATPGVKIGLFCSTPMVAVSRAIGRKKTMEMLLTGDPVSANEALALGLVNRVVPAEKLESTTRELALKIAASSPYVVGLGKQAFYKQIDLPQHQAYEYTGEVMSQNAESKDAHEGISAFLEKRKPHWK
ncbi:MAG TPA: enoyl-CoA hydratase [Candidatus Eremiobacteraceae bacterium]|nr:enoyl-CoA hydratase [Candidatus Eremiobacteraceae bacterium]